MKCGIVGLPNVGKSSLFNAITKTSIAQAANYPFCTIEPNVANVAVNDFRLLKLAQIAGSKQIIPSFIEIYDIAGLVKGASKGEGLGNKFLSHIRDVDAIIHLVRCFKDDDITHVENDIDPVRDIEIINTELMLSDLESVDKYIVKIEKNVKKGDKIANDVNDVLMLYRKHLNNGQMLNTIDSGVTGFSKDVEKELSSLNLITIKPVIFVANVDESSLININQYARQTMEFAAKNNSGFAQISVKIESEISQIESDEEKTEFLKMLGLEKSGVDNLAVEAFKLLNLISFFTIGPKEAHSWKISNGTLAPIAAGKIHSDIEKGFIRVEVISYDDYILYNGENGAKEFGKLRIEGKEYVMQDGDIVHFRFNV